MNLKIDQKIRLCESDFVKPYRITSPTFSSVSLRFRFKEDAEKELKKLDGKHQAILSFVDTENMKVNIIGYSAPPVRRFRKE